MQLSNNRRKPSTAANRKRKPARRRPRVEVLERRMLLAHDVSFSESDLTRHDLDVNHDSLVSPLDALMTVNAVNRARLENIQPPPELDVTGDGQVNSLDVDAILAELTHPTRLRELTASQRIGFFDPYHNPNNAWNRTEPADAAESSQPFIWSSATEMKGESADAPTAREHGKILPLRFTDSPSSGKGSSENSTTFIGPARERFRTAGVNHDRGHVSELDAFFADEERLGHSDGTHHASSEASASGGRPFVSIEATDEYAFEEGTDTGEFRVYRDGGSGGTDDLTVHLSVGGTATEGDDYQTLSKSVTIPAGDPDVTFLVTPIDDDVESEGIETVVVKIEPDQNEEGYNRNILCDAVTIEDNDSGGSGGSTPSGDELEFSVAEVHAQRTSGPSEGLYRIKQSEHFDIGSTFRFELVCAQGDTSDIRWDLLKPLSATTDEVLASGTGTSFAYTFSSSDDQSSPYVRFYDDANQNGAWDTSEEVNLNSPTFIVQEKKPYPIKVDVSDAIMDQPDSAKVQSLLDGAANVLLRKDSYYDARSAVRFNLDAHTVFPATDSDGARPDPVETADRQKHFDAEAHIVLVDVLKPASTLGVAVLGDWEQIIVEYTDRSEPLLHNVIAHEIGHGVGLAHAGHYNPQVMNDKISEDNVEQSLADADEYD